MLQAFLHDMNNFQLYGFKYSEVELIIYALLHDCKQSFLFNMIYLSISTVRQPV